MKYYVLCFIIFVCTASAQRMKTQPINAPCTRNEDCESKFAHFNGTECLVDVCICPNATNPRRLCLLEDAKPTLSFRNTDKKIGQDCTYDTDCYLENLKCNTTSNKCDCVDKYVPSSDGQKCLQVPNKIINDTCEDNNQCLAVMRHTQCSQSQCICMNNYYLVDDKCVPKKEFGENCAEDQDCANIKGAICSPESRTCVCQPNFMPNVNYTACIEIPKTYGAMCTNSNTCKKLLDNSVCVNNTCQCKPKFYYSYLKMACLRAKESIGDSCYEEGSCFLEDPERGTNVLECTDDHICNCISGYESSHNDSMQSYGCTYTGASSFNHNFSIMGSIFTVFFIFLVS